jgi:hypothetical protein
MQSKQHFRNYAEIINPAINNTRNNMPLPIAIFPQTEVP